MLPTMTKMTSVLIKADRIPGVFIFSRSPANGVIREAKNTPKIRGIKKVDPKLKSKYTAIMKNSILLIFSSLFISWPNYVRNCWPKEEEFM